jgi:hypothetical protein
MAKPPKKPQRPTHPLNGVPPPPLPTWAQLFAHAEQAFTQKDWPVMSTLLEAMEEAPDRPDRSGRGDLLVVHRWYLLRYSDIAQRQEKTIQKLRAKVEGVDAVVAARVRLLARLALERFGAAGAPDVSVQEAFGDFVREVDAVDWEDELEAYAEAQAEDAARLAQKADAQE